MKILRLGSRKSALAQAQANWVAGRLRAAFPDLRVEILLITTSGDRQSSASPLVGEAERSSGGGTPHPLPSPARGAGNAPGGLKALFTKEIEEALLDRRIDLAVHSLKDMAADLPPGLVIGAVPEREDPRDVWISKNGTRFRDIPKEATIGTGAVRRQAQLKRLLPQANLVAIRGNVDTRLRKLVEGDLDGIVLALAGLKRLGKESSATELLAPDMVIPAIGQGCLGIQIREKESAIVPYLKVLDHPESHLAARAERAFLKALGGNCQTPIAGHAKVTGPLLAMEGLVISPDGRNQVREKMSGPSSEAEVLGHALAEKLLAMGADKILLG